MVAKYADLHFHTFFSDGHISPSELAGFIGRLDRVQKDDILADTGLERVLEFLEKQEDRTGIRRLLKKVGGCADVVRNIRTFAKLDHDTLLGSEEFLNEMEEKAQGKRVLVGTELTSLAQLPEVGWYAIHIPVFFYDERGFNLLERNRHDRHWFFRSIEDNYLGLINRCAEANNFRFIHALRQRCNVYFFKTEEVITEKMLLDAAASKLKEHIYPHSAMNLGNHIVSVHHTDIAEVLSKNGVEGTPEEIAHRYFRREGRLYIPQSENPLTVHIDELLDQLRQASSRSPVKVKVGIGHPSTYVRVIAKKLSKKGVLGMDNFYGSWSERAASKLFRDEFVRPRAEAGVIDMIETDYPRYSRSPPDVEDVEAFEEYLEYLKQEAGFAARQKEYWRAAATELKLSWTGGSDAHFRKGSPMIGCGFCGLAFPDNHVDDIFRY